MLVEGKRREEALEEVSVVISILGREDVVHTIAASSICDQWERGQIHHSKASCMQSEEQP